jgi:hypothetical protein
MPVFLFHVCLYSAILNPPNCANWKSKIVTSLTNYLADVKDMSNYGSAMTAAMMNLVPVSRIRM